MVELLELAWSHLADFLNSNFTAALAGAFAGAMAARRIERRASQLDGLQQELRATNAAIMLAFLICNTAINLKVQYVKGIHEKYVELRRRHAAMKQHRTMEADTPTFEFELDLREIDVPQFPVAELRTQVFEKLSAVGRPLALASQIGGAVSSLSSVMRKRCELIERIRTAGDNRQIVIAQYLGEPYGDGHRSEEFPDSVQHLLSTSDDVIFFSELLVADLIEHGESLVKRLDKLSKSHGERVSQADFGPARDQGLLPDHAQYSNWTTSFAKSEQKLA